MDRFSWPPCYWRSGSAEKGGRVEVRQWCNAPAFRRIKEVQLPKRFNPDSVGAVKLTLTLSSSAADELRGLAERDGTSLAELVRRAMGVYRFISRLRPEEQLQILNTETGQTTRLLPLVGSM